MKTVQDMQISRFNSMVNFVKELGIPLQFCSEDLDTQGFPAAMNIDIESGAVSIHLSTQSSYAPVPVKVQLLAHEISHVLRGEHLVLLANKDLDKKMWNWAADSAINLTIDTALVEKYFSREGVEFSSITYERLRESLPELPPVHPGTRIVYEALMKAQEESRKELEELLEKFKEDIGDIPELTPEEMATLRKNHVKLLVQARKMLQEGRYEGVLDASQVGALPTNRNLRNGVYNPEVIASIDEILEVIDGTQGSLQFARTWTRPPRVQNSDFLSRGAGYVPRVKVGIIVDVSGSMTEYEPAIVSTSRYVQENHEAFVVIHDDQVLYQGDRYPDEVNWGGGTAFREAYEVMRDFNPELVIHFTDGETGDLESTPLPTCPVVWVQPKGTTAHLRENDREIYF